MVNATRGWTPLFFVSLSLTLYLHFWAQQCAVPPQSKIMSWLQLSTQQEDDHLLLLRTTYRCSRLSI